MSEGLRALTLTFSTLEQMAKTNVFPLYLDAAPVTLTANDSTYDVVSSRVILDGTSATVQIRFNNTTDVDHVTVVQFECITAAHTVTVQIDPEPDDASSHLATLPANEPPSALYVHDAWTCFPLSDTTLTYH